MLKFECPNCDDGDLVFVFRPATVREFITGFTTDGELVSGHTAFDLDDDLQEWFECFSCGYRLQDEWGEDIDTVKGAREWLETEEFLRLQHEAAAERVEAV